MAVEQLTEDLLDDIEDAVARGATTNLEIASSLGWTERKFRGWKDGERKNGISESDQIRQAIKRGKKTQRGYILRKAKNSLVKMVEGYSYEETKIEDSNLKGITKTVTTKYKEPNTTAVLFALVNNSDGEYKSINNIQPEEIKSTKPKTLKIGFKSV